MSVHLKVFTDSFLPITSLPMNLIFDDAVSSETVQYCYFFHITPSVRLRKSCCNEFNDYCFVSETVEWSSSMGTARMPTVQHILCCTGTTDSGRNENLVHWYGQQQYGDHFASTLTFPSVLMAYSLTYIFHIKPDVLARVFRYPSKFKCKLLAAAPLKRGKL